MFEIKTKQITSDNLPQFLYKYRNWADKCHQRLITHQEIYFAQPSSFNDPFDGNIPTRWDLINYCMLILDVSLGLNSEIINVDIETDGQNILRFVGENGEKKKFKTITEVLNCMYSNGWEFKESIGKAVVGVE